MTKLSKENSKELETSKAVMAALTNSIAYKYYNQSVKSIKDNFLGTQ